MFPSLCLFRQLFLLVLFTCPFSVLAIPHGRRASNIVARQDASFTAQTVTMTQTQNTPQGTVVSICTMIFTPTNDGQVQEVSQCVVTNPGDNGSASTSVFTSDVSTATTDAGNPAISVNPVSSIAVSATSDSSSPTSTATAAPNNSPASTSVAALGGFSTTSIPAASAAAALQSGSAVADNSASSASSTPFVIPGKKLQVLPIGLGVFAGISVIALIVVALVTYERTKYRRAFRQRKLAETAAPIGYGGTQISSERF